MTRGTLHEESKSARVFLARSVTIVTAYQLPTAWGMGSFPNRGHDHNGTWPPTLLFRGRAGAAAEVQGGG
jgi:hypothetical protein